MSQGPPKAFVTLQAPGPGAYRVTVVGSGSANLHHELLLGGRPVETRLAPGRYTAFLESLSSPGRTSITFSVRYAGEITTVELGPDPDKGTASQAKRISRPSHVSLNEAVPVELFPQSWDDLSSGQEQGRRFSIGLSVDTQPGQQGGWQAAACDIALVERSDDHAELIVRPSQKNVFRKLRLTVSVDGDVAWRTALAPFADGIRVVVRPADASVPDVSVRLRPVDERVAMIVGGLQRALPDELDQILEASSAGAEPTLSKLSEARSPAAAAELVSDTQDPWAAAAAAVFFARSGEIAKVADWARHLADAFEIVPDASVAAAWAEVAVSTSPQEGESRCLDRLVRARKMGAPYFIASNVLALEMLTMLGISGSSTVRRKAKTEREIWHRRSRRALRTGAFLSWELPPGTLSRGSLPARSYTTILEGRVKQGSLSLSDDFPARTQSSASA